jgi:hypothetical protein
VPYGPGYDADDGRDVALSWAAYPATMSPDTIAELRLDTPGGVLGGIELTYGDLVMIEAAIARVIADFPAAARNRGLADA